MSPASRFQRLVRAPRSPRGTRFVGTLALAAAVALPWAASAQTDPNAAQTPPTTTNRAAGATNGPASAPRMGGTGAADASPGGARENLSRGDRDFLEKAAHAGLAEVQASQLAMTKATNPAVKTFAQKMVDDHTRVGNELKALAAAKQYEPPTEPALMQKAKMKLLDTADGAKFDQRYVKSMGVEAHEDTVKLFRKASTGARDAEVRAFASKTLPGLQEHLDMARQLDKSMHARRDGTSRGTTPADNGQTGTGTGHGSSPNGATGTGGSGGQGAGSSTGTTMPGSAASGAAR